MKIYTKTGDDGTTGLYGGARVSKADPRVEAYGAVDETNAAVGIARAAGLPAPIEAVLARAQATLFQVGGALATPPGTGATAPAVLEADVLELEHAIDALEATLPPCARSCCPRGARPRPGYTSPAPSAGAPSAWWSDWLRKKAWLTPAANT